MCPATLPAAGSKVDIVGKGTATVLRSHPALQSGLYDGRGVQNLPPGFDSGCTLDIQYADGTTDVVSAAQAAGAEELDTVTSLLLVAGCQAAIVALDSTGPTRSSWDRMQDEYNDWIEDALEQNAGVKGLRERAAELGGDYWGGSEESDDGDQAIRVTFRFEADGRLRGHGRDGVDGTYKITGGQWILLPNGSVELAWKEVYDEGFTAICMGSLDGRSGRIDAQFTSSRDVSGSFTLAKKPSIF